MQSINSKAELYFEMDRVEEQIDRILAYIKKNPQSDPNAFEMNHVMFEVAHIRWSTRKFEVTPYEFLQDEKMKSMDSKFQRMMSIRMMQLKESQNGLDGESLYQYFDEGIRFIATLNSLGTPELQSTLDSLCGVNLYCKQQVRDLKGKKDAVIYHNPSEYRKLVSSLATQQDANALCASSSLRNCVETLAQEVGKMVDCKIADWEEMQFSSDGKKM